MTSDYIVFPVTLTTLVTLTALASYCEPGYRQQLCMLQKNGLYRVVLFYSQNYFLLCKNEDANLLETVVQDVLTWCEHVVLNHHSSSSSSSSSSSVVAPRRNQRKRRSEGVVQLADCVVEVCVCVCPCMYLCIRVYVCTCGI